MGVCKDGGLEMLGSGSGFVARIKQRSPSAEGFGLLCLILATNELTFEITALSTARLLPKGLYQLQ